VLSLIAQGDSNKQITPALVLAVDTVKRHVGNILGKLDANNGTQAVVWVRSLGLLSDERKERQLVFSGKKNGGFFDLTEKWFHFLAYNKLSLFG
jgi:Bacterial regulatory proteins, luxR family